MAKKDPAKDELDKRKKAEEEAKKKAV